MAARSPQPRGDPVYCALALQAAEMGPLPPEVWARLDTLYESDFGRL